MLSKVDRGHVLALMLAPGPGPKPGPMTTPENLGFVTPRSQALTWA